MGFGDGERKAGEGAAFSTKSNYRNTVWGFNRFLGMKQNNPNLKEELTYVGAKWVPRENQSIGFELRCQGEQLVYSPEQLTAMFLKKLRRIYEHANVGCKEVVISVPPYFSSVERQALLDATRIADLNCLKLLNETTAIGLSYGLFRHAEFQDKPRHVVFFDLGYSKLTVSVMAFKSSGFSILAQGWEPNIGARNMDRLLINKLAEDFAKKYKKDPRENPKAYVRMSDAVEKCRKTLSANVEVPVSIESVLDDRDIACNIKRADFEAMISPLIERMESLTKRVLAESKVKEGDIHSVEMVGEASRIPIVIKRVQECVGASHSRTMNSADCVARGCAIQCAMLSPLFKVKDYTIGDCNPFPIQIVFSVPKTDADPVGKKVKTLFDRGCNFPVTKALSFENRKDTIELQLKYDDPNSLALGGPVLLGNYKVTAGQPKEDRFAVSVKISLDQNMICTVCTAEVVEDYMEEKKGVVKRDVPAPPPPKKEPMTDIKPDAKVEAKTEAKAEAKTEAKPEAKTEAKPEAKTEAKPEAKTEPMSDTKPEGKAEGKDKKDEKMEDVAGAGKGGNEQPNVPQPQQEYEIQHIPKKRRTPIDFLYEIHGLAAAKITECIEKEKQLEHADNLIIGTKESKNSFESYIYDIRGKLSSELQEYTDPHTAQSIIEAANHAEQWLFSEGQNQAKEAYDTRLAQLQKLGDPIMRRYRDFLHLFDESTLLSNVSEDTIERAKALDKIEHVTADEKAELAKLIEESKHWLQNTIEVLHKCDKKQAPPVKATDFSERITKLKDVPSSPHSLDASQTPQQAQARGQKGGEEGRPRQD